MPMILNSPIQAPAGITPGSVDIIFGTTPYTAYPYDGMMNYWYEYNYGILFILESQLTGLPIGASINSLNFQIYNTNNGTYPENLIDVRLGRVPNTFTQFPFNLRINLQSSTDTTWNSALTTQVCGTNINTTYIQTTAMPDTNWAPGITFTTPYVYTGGNLLISMNSKSGTYTPGTSSQPVWIGKVQTGTFPRIWNSDYRTSPVFPDTQITQTKHQFRPNIKINYS